MFAFCVGVNLVSVQFRARSALLFMLIKMLDLQFAGV